MKISSGTSGQDQPTARATEAFVVLTRAEQDDVVGGGSEGLQAFEDGETVLQRIDGRR